MAIRELLIVIKNPKQALVSTRTLAYVMSPSLQPVWPDVAKFRHFGYFLWALANFFFRKVAKENGEIFGYFLKWAKFLVFNAINHFSNGKNGQFWTFLVKYFNFWAIFKLEISGSFLLWAITWAINKGPKHHKMA